MHLKTFIIWTLQKHIQHFNFITECHPSYSEYIQLRNVSVCVFQVMRAMDNPAKMEVHVP